MRKNIILALCGCAFCFTGCNKDKEPVDLGTFCTYTELQKEYLTNPDPTAVPEEAQGKADLDKPVPITFKINDETVRDNLHYKIDYSYNYTYDDAKIDEHTTYSYGKKAVITNLELGKTYYFKVTLNNELIEKGTFKTEPGFIRILDIDGMKNCRDLGGYETSLGYVKPNMVFRTGELNHVSEGFGPDDSYITDQGAATMINELKLKSEIDLRMVDEEIPEEYIHESILKKDYGADVIMKEIRIDYNDFKLDEPKHYEEIKEFFTFMSSEDNYPMDFHCHIGTDRTGMFGALIRLILGDTIDHMHYDYMLSNFAYIGGSRAMDDFDAKCLNVLNDEEGSNITDKTYNFLTNKIGVTPECINSIRNILLVNK